jgi:integrase
MAERGLKDRSIEYMVAIHAGLRRGELLGLKWTDADLDAGALTVRRSLNLDGAFKVPKNRAAKRTLKVTPSGARRSQGT